MSKNQQIAKTDNTFSPLERFQAETLKVWEEKSKIRELFAPELTDNEFEFFVSLGIALGANPFMREIWAVKFKDKPASIFCGRDFYRRKAQEFECDGYLTKPVDFNALKERIRAFAGAQPSG